MLNKLICYLMGHKRGRRCRPEESEYPATWDYAKSEEAYKTGYDIFMCPRCYFTWKRKAKKAA